MGSATSIVAMLNHMVAVANIWVVGKKAVVGAIGLIYTAII